MAQDLVGYYNKFSEDKRLKSRHGQVEWAVTIKYIEEQLKEMKNPAILDVGAGTGAYSVYLAEKGYNVTAVELVKFNLGILKSKTNKVKACQGDARNLKRFKDESFDVVLLFGPMYHLLRDEDKVLALNEAKRVVKKNGFIFVAYVMNDYAIITYAFKEGNIKQAIEDGRIDDKFNILFREDDLYSYVRLEKIDKINKICGLERVKIFAPDGAADYIRPTLNNMDEESFDLFIKYQIAVAEKKELLGASSHIVDVLKKP